MAVWVGVDGIPYVSSYPQTAGDSLLPNASSQYAAQLTAFPTSTLRNNNNGTQYKGKSTKGLILPSACWPANVQNEVGGTIQSYGTCLHNFWAPFSMIGIQASFSNICYAGNAGGTEFICPNGFTVNASLSLPYNGGTGSAFYLTLPIPFTFNGQRYYTFTNNSPQIVTSDVIYVNIAQYQEYIIRTNAVPTVSGGYIPCSRQTAAWYVGDGYGFTTITPDAALVCGNNYPINSGGPAPNNGSDQTLGYLNQNWCGAYAGYGYGPFDIQGIPASGVSNLAVAAVVGDSIDVGFGEPAGECGFWQRAFINNTILYRMCARSGQTGGNFFSSLQGSQLQRWQLESCTHAVWGMGINDVRSGANAAYIENNDIQFGVMCQRLGIPAVCRTILPCTTSINSWTTVAGQTVTSGETVRQQVNVWRRAGMPISPTTGLPVAVGTSGALIVSSPFHPFDAVFDTAGLIEANSSNVITPGGNFWYCGPSNNTAYTIDGVHCYTVGYVLLQPAMQPSFFINSLSV